MIKNYVLDTNVLLHDPLSIFAFEDNNVCIPIYVIEEIDQFKRDMGELGRNARETARTIDKLRNQGDLKKGVKLRNGGHLRVIFASDDYTEEEIIVSVQHEMDDLILSAEMFESDNQLILSEYMTGLIPRPVLRPSVVCGRIIIPIISPWLSSLKRKDCSLWQLMYQGDMRILCQRVDLRVLILFRQLENLFFRLCQLSITLRFLVTRIC